MTPSDEMDELFATVFSVQRFVLWLLFSIGLATILIGTLVFLLSYQLRETEFQHLRHLGADPLTLRALVVFEAAFVVLASLLASGILLLLLHGAASVAIRHFLS